MATEAVECCMCGDRGLSDELVPCASCNFRSQHRYCSSRYPDAESYDTCNWCLSERNDGNGTPREKHGRTSSQELLNSGSPSPRKRKAGKGGEGAAKRRNMPPPTSPSGKVGGDGDEGERSSSVMPMRYVLRNNRGRRYKLLDEVST
ncbi:hypothetical protein MLD38_024663 [Melastoma candidum]|uniref:Uncharacterized protein n=1 Tax=Melastoma candidum TaxID=119954 RepID=A0ACB9NZS8_9MYRT|nr:hypothetical protein MLD38_024663 [Melastoma candidum]